MDELTITDVDTGMGYAAGRGGAEENQIALLQAAGGADPGPAAVLGEAGGIETADLHAAVLEHVVHEAGAVEGLGTLGGPDVLAAQLGFGQLDGLIHITAGIGNGGGSSGGSFVLRCAGGRRGFPGTGGIDLVQSLGAGDAIGGQAVALLEGLHRGSGIGAVEAGCFLIKVAQLIQTLLQLGYIITLIIGIESITITNTIMMAAVADRIVIV